jgi:hypothetical protein
LLWWDDLGFLIWMVIAMFFLECFWDLNDPQPNGISYTKQSQSSLVQRSPFRQYLCIARITKFDFGAMAKPGRKSWKRF